jgi:hypothetical protein
MSKIIFIITEDNIYQLIDKLSISYKIKLKKIFTDNINGALIEIDSNHYDSFKNNNSFLVFDEDQLSKTKKIKKYFDYEKYKQLLFNKK